MKRNILISFLLVLGIMGHCRVSAQDSPEVRALSLDEFIRLATANDTEFEEILIDELVLQYQKDLRLPARDIVLSVKQNYDVFLRQDREEPDTTVSLSKLFPYAGTEITATYDTESSFTSDTNSGGATLTIAQPIAENAFGKVTRLRGKIIGLEVDVARHQIVEAYEDYLAALISAYYSWAEAYENYKVGESSYNQNVKLLENIKERAKKQIALPIDVNKTTLQVMAKREDLHEFEVEYQNATNLIARAVRHEGPEGLVPVVEEDDGSSGIVFEAAYAGFQTQSRTYKVLNFLEERSMLSVEKEANELLPSINVLVGYEVRGDEHPLNNSDRKVFAGLSLDWPFGDQVDRAEFETAKIDNKKTQLNVANTHHRLYEDLKNLYQQIEREKKLLAIAKEKIGLARSVLEDETENYSFGKVSLNDYIDAVNVLDNNRFNKIFHEALLKKLSVEWLRITDRLIDKKQIEDRIKHEEQQTAMD